MGLSKTLYIYKFSSKDKKRNKEIATAEPTRI
jgi:hypothetical protein